MRITIAQGAFLPVPPLIGGAVEKVWFALGQEFARHGHQVTHLSRAYPGLPASETIAGVRHQRVSGFASPATTAQRLLLDLWYALRIHRRLPQADILVTHSFWLPALPRRGSRGHVYVHVARRPKHQLWLYRKAALQTVSGAIREAILAELPGAAGRVRVIPYPLSEHHLQPTLPEGGRTILYAGRVHPEKGVHLLVRAFMALNDSVRAGWKLRIVGPWEHAQGGGGEKHLAELQAIAKPAGPGIEFAGPVFDETLLAREYAGASIFAYPSLAEKGETFGLAVLEAMAGGCAPVVSRLDCFRDFIRHGANGLAFDHRAASPADQLATALSGLMLDQEHLRRLRESAWKTARDYALPRIAGLYLEDFSRLTGLPAWPNPSAEQT